MSTQHNNVAFPDELKSWAKALRKNHLVPFLSVQVASISMVWFLFDNYTLAGIWSACLVIINVNLVRLCVREERTFEGDKTSSHESANLIGVLGLIGVLWSTPIIALRIFALSDYLATLPLLTIIYVSLLFASWQLLHLNKKASDTFAIILFMSMALIALSVQTEEMLVYTLFILIILGIFLSNHRNQMSKQSRVVKIDNMELISILSAEKEKADAAKKAAEKANVSKSKFLAAASHDLRQPLHTMGLLLFSLKNSVVDAQTKVLVEQIIKSHESMEELFCSLLDISKLDAGVVEPQIQPTELGVIIRQLIAECEIVANKKALVLEAEDIQVMVRSDPILLARILRNIIHNGIVHTEKGTVKVEFNERSTSVDIHVTDTGPGIDEGERSRIYDEFHQIKNSQAADEKGLGLGLSIVQRLCSLLGHDISLKSKIGEGSRFTLTVAKAADGVKKSPLIVLPGKEESFARDKLNFLIIDDNKSITQAMTSLLEHWGQTVVSAHTTDEVWCLIDTNYRPSFIICDYSLNSKDSGIQIITKLKKAIGHDIPALLITGDTSKEVRNEARIHGLDIVHKPVKPARLRTIINRQLDTLILHDE